MRPDTLIINFEYVRRYAHSGSATIQAFLEHLRAKGIGFVPRPLLLEGDYEELSYLPGLCYQPTEARPREAWDISHLEALGYALRRCHDASEDFLARYRNAAWFPFAEACDSAEVICHNDLGPWNVPLDGPTISIIDWEMAAPGKRIWDIAHIAWNWVPLYSEEERARVNYPEPWSLKTRLAGLLNGYGESRWSHHDVLEEVSRRQARILNLVALSASTRATVLQNWGNVEVGAILADRAFVCDLLLENEVRPRL